MPNENYNITLITGSYPQIHNNEEIKNENKDKNRRKHEWISAIKFTLSRKM